MIVTGSQLNSFIRFNAPQIAAVAAPVSQPQETDWQAVATARRHMTQLAEALETIDRLLRLRPGGGAGHGDTAAVSTADLGLDPSPATPATLASAEEVNTTPTSFTPFGPAWTDGSSALLTVGGVYDGSGGAGTLSFQVKNAGTHGQKDLRIRVFDTDGRALEDVNISKSDPLDQVYTLANGLTLQLGAGALIKNDTLSVDVSDTVGSRVDPTKPFNGVRNDNPNLEPGLGVVAGSFEVNGVDIAVQADDSLTDVLARISASAAGVSATFDAASERVLLTQKTPGSVPDIVLGNDSSGFLAAAKLDGVTATPGTDYEPDLPLATLPEFTTVQSGTLVVNGTALGVDPADDSLVAVLDRISASSAGAFASLDPTAQRVSIVSRSAGARLVLDSNDTGFFPAINIADGTYRASQTSDSGLSKRRSYQLADAVESASRALEGLFEGTLMAAVPSLQSLRGQVGAAVSQSLDAVGARAAAKFGFRGSNGIGSEPLTFEARDRQRLVRQLQRDVAPVRALLVGEGDARSDGLVGRLRALVESGLGALGQPQNGLGSLLDLFA